jgi:hypothetical protein
MNERIEQLALLAGEYVNSVYVPPVRSKTPGKIWEDGHVGWHTQFNEKFAELIVRECVEESMAEIMSDEDIAQEDDPLVREFLKGNNQGIVDAVVRFRNHFGVEP